MNIYSYSRFLRISFFILILGALIVPVVTGQSTISLEQAIDRAMKNNQDIRIANQSIHVERAKFEQSKGMMKPYVGLSVMDMVSNNPLNVFGYKLLQEQVSQADFDPTILNNPDLRNQFNISLMANMPLFNMENKFNQEAAQSQVAMKEAIADRTVQGIEFEVTKTYYMLDLSYESVKVLSETYQAAQLNYEIGSNFFNQGLLLKSDLLDMQIMLNQSELALATAEKELANVQADMNHLLNTETFTEFVPTESLTQETNVDMSGSLSQDRADFRAIKLGIQSLGNKQKAADKSIIPKVNVFTGFEMNDQIPFENRANNYHIGLRVTWDIYKGNMRKSTTERMQAEILEQEMMLDQKTDGAELEISKVERNIEDILKQIDLQELSIQQAEESLRIRKNRFEQGLEKTADLVDSEMQLSQKKLMRLQALFALKVQLAYHHFLIK